MRKSRYTDEQIIGFIKQADAGMSVADLCRREGFSSATFYKWRAKFGGMEASDAKRLRDLAAENNRLKKQLDEGHGQMGCRSSALEKHEKALSTQKDCSACDVMNGDLRKLSHHLR